VSAVTLALLSVELPVSSLEILDLWQSKIAKRSDFGVKRRHFGLKSGRKTGFVVTDSLTV
jgi:hypothetical protein